MTNVERYETIVCELCAGAGQRYDATNADKVCTDGIAAATCSQCRGAGMRQRLIPSAEFLAYRERERAALAAMYDDTAEPGTIDWMEW